MHVNYMKNKYLKKLSVNFFIKFICAFILLFFVVLCVYQNLAGKSLFRWFCKKIDTQESALKGNTYKDLRAYSMFLKDNLFKNGHSKNVLVMPGQNKTSPNLLYSSRADFLSFYLFPVKIEINNSYKVFLEESVFKKLNKLPLVTKMSNVSYVDKLDRRYCLVRGIEVNDYKKWAIYAFSTEEMVSIFTLPMDWQGFENSD